eukprot:9247214-Pyramimonas_sp.AAC.1
MLQSKVKTDGKDARQGCKGPGRPCQCFSSGLAIESGSGLTKEARMQGCPLGRRPMLTIGLDCKVGHGRTQCYYASVGGARPTRT